MTDAAAEIAEPTEDAALGALPEWDLSDLYDGPDSADLKRDLDTSDADAKAFHGKFNGRVADLSAEELGAAIREYERIDEAISRVMSYAQLLHAGDQSDPELGRFYQTIQERVTAISTHLLFFTLELNRVAGDAMADKLDDPAVRPYAAWIRDVRAFRPHQLSDELERLLHEKQVAGRSAWIRLFDETMASLRFPLDAEMLTLAEVLDRLSGPEAKQREAAARSLGGVLRDNQRLFALITNTLAKDKQIEDTWRDFTRPVSSRNLANHVEDEVVDALASAVRQAYPRLSHRYYEIKARWFGGETLAYWDRNAPLPEEDTSRVPWNDAVTTVLDAYGAFSGELADVGRRFFDSPWIDAPARPGKASGAFAHPTVPSAHPYLLLNYQGRPRDVMTLAHELGHGVHQVLAGPRGHLLADTPLTLAETASVFGEMLTFRAMLDAAPDMKRRKTLLANKVEDMLNTVVRQIAFYEFERQVHDERKDGELAAERLAEIWMQVQRDSLGPAITFDDDYKCYWAYIPHFVHTPFYVYAYAFGDCLVNSLYAVYQDAHHGFVEKYLDMLRAGGTLRHKELLAPFGLDASDPDFWGKGLDVISGLIDELEAADG